VQSGAWVIAGLVAAQAAVGAEPGPDDEPPPLSPEELALVDALTAEVPEPAWSAPRAPFARSSDPQRLHDTLAPTVTRALDGLPLPVLGFGARVDQLYRYVGPHRVERAVDGWTDTDPWLWQSLEVVDLDPEQGAPFGALRLEPLAPPAEDGLEISGAAALRSADRSLLALGGSGGRRGVWAGRVDAAIAGGGDVRVGSIAVDDDAPVVDFNAAPRWTAAITGSGVLGDRVEDPGHLRFIGRADLRGKDLDSVRGSRSDLFRALLGLDGRLRWGERGFLEATGSYQQLSRTSTVPQRDTSSAVGQVSLRMRTPDLGPLFVLARGHAATGSDFERVEAGGELGIEVGPIAMRAGPSVLAQRVNLGLESTVAGWSGRLRLQLPAGWFVAADTRRGADVVAAAVPRASSGTVQPDGAAVGHALVVGPGLATERAWFRLRAVGRWFDRPDARVPEWVIRGDGAWAIARRFTVAGAFVVRPNFELHLSARYDTDRVFVELHGRGRTDSFESGFEDVPGAFVLGFQSGLALGAGFRLALSVENVTDASVEALDGAEPGRFAAGIDGRVLLSWRGP
jgi:hypothetical protein